MTHAIRSTVPEYGVWENMNTRCFNQKSKKWKDYGGRGITICPQWLGPGGFQRFYRDMGPRPSPTHSIERKNVHGNYEPGNCVWATPAQQARNRRDTRMLTLGSETMTLTDWAKRLDMNPASLHERLSSGWSVERALTTPPRNVNRQHKGAA